MKKLIFILMVSAVFASCGTKETSINESPVVSVKPSDVPSTDVQFSDPARIAGSSFGNFFISMIRTQNYDMALKFTSTESIEKFGADKIKEKYQNFKFNYTLAQKSISKDGNTFTIAYTTNEYATGKIKKMTVILENDTCKLVLPDNLDELLK